MTACPVADVNLGKRLARKLRSPGVFRLLPAGSSDWGAGGCGVLAKALVKALPGAKLRGVYGDNVVLHHAVVEHGGCYLDHDGAQTKAELLSKMEGEGVERPRLGPWNDARAVRAGIVCPAVSLSKLQRALAPVVGKRR